MKPGISELEIDGQKRGFLFGTMAMGIASAEEKCDIVVLTERLSKPTENILTVLNFMYGAAAAWCNLKRIPVDFTPADVSIWLDEIGLDTAVKMLNDGMRSPNSQAPETPGPK